MDLNGNSDEFDSFFYNNEPKTSSQQKLSKMNDPLEDLFGLEEKSEGRSQISRKSLTGGTSASRSKPGVREDLEDDDDLGFDPKKPKVLVKSQNLFDDLLGPSETKRPQTSAGSNIKSTISRQSTETTTDTSNFQAHGVRAKTAQGRRTSNMPSTPNPDPLGIFSREKDNSKLSSRAASPKTQKRGSTADWLGLSKEPENESSKTEVSLQNVKTTGIDRSIVKEVPEVSKNLNINENLTDTDAVDKREKQPDSKDLLPLTNEPYAFDLTGRNLMLMNTLNRETQQGFSTLKYQEQQLIMASQMKQQERVLVDMQLKQESLLQQQEQQFKNLLQQQMQRHQQLEELITQQQQRINNHLQLLMAQPPPTLPLLEISSESRMTGRKVHTEESVEAEVSSREFEKEKQAALELIQLEADQKRLELENLRLEELIANTKSNYEREIELLEKSYKKQIEVLEEHLSSIEKRLKSELQELQTYFQNKMATLEQEKIAIKKTCEEELSNLKQDHEDGIRKLRKNQEEELEMLKEEHRRMLDNVRQAKLLEFAAVQESGSYLDCLKVASDNLQDLTGGLEELKENMHKKIEIQHLEREKILEQREKKIEDKERRLKVAEESNESEKFRLMELVSNLELQMSKMSKESAEENWQLRQKLASIDAEKLAFSKEKDLFREQMLRDEERIKELKEQQLLEAQKIHVQIQEERAQLHVEKTKFEMEKRLQSSTDIQKDRLEVEAAVQVAQDAARKSDLERERFYKIQRQLEQQKRDLNEKEHALNVREEELHEELLSYRLADRLAQEVQKKAKLAEQYYQKKLQLLQQKINETAEKEAYLSQERLLLAQDRIALHALKTKFSEQPKCSLCQLSQKNQEIAHNLEVYPTVNGTSLDDKSNYQSTYDYTNQASLVDRILDANIADSLRKMNSNSNLPLEWQNFLDDDHKKMMQKEEYELQAESNLAKTNI